MQTKSRARSGELTRFDRIVLHLRSLYRDHMYRWHLAGVWRELHQFIDAPTHSLGSMKCRP